MRRMLSIFMLLVYLFANTELHELAKLGQFVAHFAEHKKEKPDITLLEFIHIHYAHGFVWDDDYQQDMKLPFKDLDCYSTTVAHTIPAEAPELLPTPASVDWYVTPVAYDPTALPSSPLSDIWQPPRSC